MIQVRSHRLNYDQSVEKLNQVAPPWSSSVERWYQLDAPAFALTDACSQLTSKVQSVPDFLILASPAGSTATDRDFVKGGANSPSKFVHTLPNIRSAPLLQVMKWTGPLLCLQSSKDQTVLTAFATACECAQDLNVCVWLWLIIAGSTTDNFRIQLFEIKNGEAAMTCQVPEDAQNDEQFLNWLDSKPLPNEFCLNNFSELWTRGPA